MHKNKCLSCGEDLLLINSIYTLVHGGKAEIVSIYQMGLKSLSIDVDHILKHHLLLSGNTHNNNNNLRLTSKKKVLELVAQLPCPSQRQPCYTHIRATADFHMLCLIT